MHSQQIKILQELIRFFIRMEYADRKSTWGLTRANTPNALIFALIFSLRIGARHPCRIYINPNQKNLEK